MAINKIRVNTDSLDADANSIGEYIRIIEGSISRLEEDYSELDTMWEGPASEAFRKVYNEDIDSLKVITENLKKINNFEIEARKKYENCEQEVGNIVASIRW